MRGSVGVWGCVAHAAEEAEVTNGHVDAARVLLAAGADLNRVAEDCDSPLAVAASQGDPAMVNFLLEAGARVDDAHLGEAAVMGGSAVVMRAMVAAGVEAERLTKELERMELD